MGLSQRVPNTINGHELDLRPKMKLKKAFPMILAFMLLSCLIFNTSFAEVKKTGTISFSGVVENVHEDFQFIIVNEVKIFISSNTQIVDEYRNVLTASDLKPKLHVAVEASRNSSGFLAQKIVIKKRKR